MLVLDTHAWLWSNDDPARLSDAAREAVEGADPVAVAAISCWEVGMLALRGRITLDRDVSQWVRQALTRAGTVALSISPQVALGAAMLEREGSLVIVRLAPLIVGRDFG